MVKSSRWIRTLCFFSTMLLILGNCGGKDEKAEGDKKDASQNEDRAFRPPTNGKIAEEQAENFVAATLALTSAHIRFQDELRTFLEIHGLAEDPEPLTADTTFQETHPKIVQEYQQLIDRWEKRRAKIYGDHDLTESEFDWIAEALGKPQNRAVAEVVRRKMVSIRGSEGG